MNKLLAIAILALITSSCCSNTEFVTPTKTEFEVVAIDPVSPEASYLELSDFATQYLRIYCLHGKMSDEKREECKNILESLK